MHVVLKHDIQCTPRGEGRVFGQWMNSSIIKDINYLLIHKKCHPKNYHSDIKYHVTLNIPPTSCTY